VMNPLPFMAIAKGDSLMLLYPDLRRARLFRHPSGTSILGQVAGVAGNMESFKEMYYLRVLPSEDEKGVEQVTLSLVPKSSRQDRFVKELKVTVTVSTWLPEKIEILEPSDGKTTLWLEGLVENAPMDESLFSLNPPADVQFQRFGESGQP
jgi:outer membrane lipoprotein-sorting protein